MSATGQRPPARILPQPGWTQRFATSLARALARAGCGLEVRGREHLPAAEPCLLCANHTSHADTFALACATGPASRRLVFLGARDYFWRFRWRRLLVQRLICLVEFERGSTMAAARANLRTLGACRDDGRIIVLFPEGTRSADGALRPFKSGAAMFADRLGLRIVPCRIDGAHAILPKGRSWPRRHRLRVTFGAPLTIPAGAPGESGAERAERYEAFMRTVGRRVADLGPAPVAEEAALTP